MHYHPLSTHHFRFCALHLFFTCVAFAPSLLLLPCLQVRDSDNTWVHDTGGDVTSIAQIVGSIAAQAEACGLGEEASQQQQQQRGIEVSVHSESSNSGDLYNIPWDETTLRLMRMGAKRKMKHVDGGGGEEALPSDSKHAKVASAEHTQYSFVCHFALFCAFVP